MYLFFMYLVIYNINAFRDIVMRFMYSYNKHNCLRHGLGSEQLLSESMIAV